MARALAGVVSPPSPSPSAPLPLLPWRIRRRVGAAVQLTHSGGGAARPCAARLRFIPGAVVFLGGVSLFQGFRFTLLTYSFMASSLIEVLRRTEEDYYCIRAHPHHERASQLPLAACS